jgi:hypothetical protein
VALPTQYPDKPIRFISVELHEAKSVSCWQLRSKASIVEATDEVTVGIRNKLGCMQLRYSIAQ